MSRTTTSSRRAVLNCEALEERLALSSQSFVDGLYHSLLGRSALTDPNSSVWVSALNNGASRESVARGIWQSVEHRGIEVDSFYRTFLYRAADPNGRAFWVNQFLSGWTDTMVETAILSSVEYISAHSTPSAYVTGVYLNVLGRAPSPVEQYNGQLALYTRGAWYVAATVLTTSEADVRAIDSYYANYLNRVPDPAGQQYWLQTMLFGQRDVESVGEGILGSDEYASLH